MRASKRAEVEALADTNVTRVAQSMPEPWIGEQPPEGLREPLGICGRDKDPRLAVGDELRHASHPGGDHRQSGGHGLEHGDRHPFRGTREHEHVGSGEQLRHVIPLASQADAPVEPQLLDLGLEPGPVGPLADDQQLARLLRQIRGGSDERQEVLRRLEPADGDEPWRLAAAVCPWDGRRIDRVRDHDRPRFAARACHEARLALVFGHADSHRCQWLDQAVRIAVEPRCTARMRVERPAVHGEDPDRHPGDRGGEPTDDARFGAARVENVRPLSPEQPDELDQADGITPGVDRAPHVTKRQEADAPALGGVPKRSVPVCGNRDVEAVDEGGDERGNVGLRTADLGERDQQEHLRAPRAGC